MAASVIIWEAANLFVGDNGPNNSKNLTLQGIQLPQMKQKMEEHQAGGAIGAISIGMNTLEALEMPFKLVGVDAQTRVQFGLGSGQSMPFTCYGVLRDKNGGRQFERKAIVFGKLLEIGEDEFSRGKLTVQDHKISEITHYELYEDGAELFYFDFFASTWRVNGIDQLSVTNAILRIS